MGVRRSDKGETNPGPGSYHHERADAHVRPSPPAKTMGGTSLSPSKSATVLVGPGYYGSQKSFVETDNKAFTIGQRIPETIVETPGPGLYENDKTKTVKASSRAVDFSSSKNGRSN